MSFIGGATVLRDDFLALAKDAEEMAGAKRRASILQALVTQ